MTSSVVEGPSGGSCTCGCTMTMQPTCPAGPIQNKYDNTQFPNNCTSTGIPNPMNNAGPCATDMWTMGGYPGFDFGYQPPAATGGACTTSATPDPTSVTYTAEDTLCTPDTPLCMTGMPCTPNLGAGYSACIEQNGDQSCPGTTFTQKHLIGSGSTFGCGSGCGCTWPMNVTCTGTMKLYTDNKCMMGEYAIPVSSAGECVAPKQGIQNNYNSYHYAADPLPPQSCSATGTSAPTNLQLSNPQTICCAP